MSPFDNRARAFQMEEFVLIVDDEPSVRELLLSQLAYLGFVAHTTGHGETALKLASSDAPPALVLLDVEMPGHSGLELLKEVKQINDSIQVVMISGVNDLGTVRECLRAGAYDYIAKPFALEDLRNTSERALERRRLLRQKREYRENLERMVRDKTEEIQRTLDMALITLAKLAESRDTDTGLHLERIAEYSQLLASALKEGPYSDRVDVDFIDGVFKASPLHDIGKVGIPDSILRKPGPLTAAERKIMRTHSRIGGDTLRSVLSKQGGPPVLQMAMEIAYSHHERWDGRGYPKGLVGEAIPLPARVVAIADAYDAITSRRPYKEAESHEEAVRRILTDRGLHFDPILVDAFACCQDAFKSIQARLMDGQPIEEAS